MNDSDCVFPWLGYRTWKAHVALHFNLYLGLIRPFFIIGIDPIFVYCHIKFRIKLEIQLRKDQEILSPSNWRYIYLTSHCI